MATHTAEGKQHLEWCLERALMEYESGGAEAAFASALSDLGKSPLMHQLGMLDIAILRDGVSKGPEGIRKAIMGYNL